MNSTKKGLLTGGVADKVGNRYERKWAVRQLLHILAGTAEEIHLEVFGVDGAEFSLKRDGIYEWHQVKRTNAGAKYTPHIVGGILSKLSQQYKNGEKVFFITTEHAGDLSSLCDNVKVVQNVAEFLIGASQKTLTNFGKFRDTVSATNDAEAFQWLQNTNIEGMSEETLTRTNLDVARLTFSTSPQNALDALSDIIDENIGQILTADHIWQLLVKRRVMPAPQVTTDQFLAYCRETYTSYEHSQCFDIGGNILVRDETSEITSNIVSAASSTLTFLQGGAGQGKTCILFQTAKELSDSGWLTLIIRSDRDGQINSALNYQEHGKKIPLPQALSQCSQDNKVLVIIDQLDAVSDVSGRHPEKFNDLAPLLRQISNLPNVHLVIGCRTHDLKFDSRFRMLKYEFETVRKQNAFDIKCRPLSEKIINNTLELLGINPQKLSSRTKTILSSPSQLYIFAQLASELSPDELNFSSIHSLLSKYWGFKKKEYSSNFPQENWNGTISVIVEILNKKQSLSISKRFLEDHETSVDALISCGILIEDGNKQIAFFHETMFDYAFARHQAKSDQSVSDWLLSTDQHLFQRGQLRQILLYLRSSDLIAFRKDVVEILAHNDIRPHLKSTTFQTLNLLTDPAIEDWEIVAPYWLDRSHIMHKIALNVTFQSLFWAKMLNEEGLLKDILTSDDEEIFGQGISILRSIFDQYPGIIAAHALWILENRPEHQIYVGHLLSVIAWDGCPPELLPVLEKTLTLGLHDHSKNRNIEGFWSFLDRKKGMTDDVAARFIGVFLQGALERGVLKEQLGFCVHNSGERILQLAQSSPSQYICSFLPIQIEIFKFYTIKKGWYDSHYGLWTGINNLNVTDVENILIYGLALALGHLTKNEPEDALEVAKTLIETNTKTGSAIILMAAESVPNKNIVPLLIELFQKYMNEEDEGSHFYSFDKYWACAFQKNISYILDQDLEVFENDILNIFPQSEKNTSDAIQRIKGRHPTFYGSTQYTLLFGLRHAKLSYKARIRLFEWERKFRHEPSLDRDMMWGGSVGSPLPKIAHEKMSDQQWLKAMQKTWPDWAHRRRKKIDGKLPGGASDLAYGGFQQQVKINPTRFIRLFLNYFDETIPSAYWKAMINGIAEAETLDCSLIDQVISKTYQYNKNDNLRAIVNCISKYAAEGIAENTISILVDIAINATDPEKDLWREETKDGPHYDGDPYYNGINTVRGQASQALHQFLYEFPEKYPQVQQAIRAGLTDKSSAVRSCAIFICPYLSHHKLDKGFMYFTQAISDTPQLLITKGARHCFKWFMEKEWKEVHIIIQRMAQSNIKKIAEEGTILIGFAWLDGLIDNADMIQYLEGSKFNRIGLATVCAANFKTKEYREKCLLHLSHFFHDDSKEVRESAEGFVGNINEGDIEAFTDMIIKYLESPAYSDDHMLFYQLEEAASVPAHLLLTAADAFLKSKAKELSDMRTSTPMSAETLSKLLLGAYNNTNDINLQSACLDRIDQLTLNGAYGLDIVLSEYDRN